MKATNAVATAVLAASILLPGCDSYEPPITAASESGDVDSGVTTDRSAALSKNVAGEADGIELLGYALQLDVGSGAGVLNAVDSYSSFTWVLTAIHPVGDVTQLAVEIPTCAAGPFSVSPTEGTNQNNSTLIAEPNVEFHPSNGSKEPEVQRFSIAFDSDEYQVGFVKAALQTNGGNQAWAYTLGPCARRFDATGSVFLDDDGDGEQATDGTEPGFVGATVVLEEYDETAGTWAELDRTTTNNSGAYVFNGIFTLGVYRVSITLGAIPDGTDLSKLVITTSPNVAVSDDSPTGDFGFDKFDILGKVYVDANDTGDTDTEGDYDAGLGSVIVRLYEADSQGDPVGEYLEQTYSSSLIAELGDYSFLNINPGDYVVAVEDIDGTLNAQLFDTFDSTEPLDGSARYSLAVGVGENSSGDLACAAGAVVPGSACGVDFGWTPNSARITATFTSESSTLTTADYNWWKKTMAAACRLYERGTDPILQLSDGGTQDLNDVVGQIQEFAFPEPFLGDLGRQADVCDMKVILERPIKTELDAYGAQLATAELNAFTPTFGLSLEGVPEYQASDPLFIYALLRFSEADYIERERDGFSSAKVGTYSGTETLTSYNGGGGGGGSGFE